MTLDASAIVCCQYKTEAALATTTTIQAYHRTTNEPVTIVRGVSESCVSIDTFDGRRIVVPWELIDIKVGD